MTARSHDDGTTEMYTKRADNKFPYHLLQHIEHM